VEAVEEWGGEREGQEVGDEGREEEVEVGQDAGRRQLRHTGDVISAKPPPSGMPRTKCVHIWGERFTYIYIYIYIYIYNVL
jgi:hypothetical protein